MMIVHVFKKWSRMLLVCWIISMISFYGCARGKDVHRGDVLQERQGLEKKFSAQPDNENIRWELAQKLFETGAFSRVKDLLPLPNESALTSSVEALKLQAQVEYLLGNYDTADMLLQRCVERAEGDVWKRLEPEIYLLYLYYRTNQYAKGAALFNGMEDALKQVEGDIAEALMMWKLMKAFGQTLPYDIDWNGTTETVVPFLQTEAHQLPVVAVEINGVPMQAFIDTGGDTFMVPPEVAASLGLETFGMRSGTFVAGARAETGFASADSLKLGDVVMRNIPVEIVSVDRCALGTGVLHQFLATMDYPNNRLVLRPKNETGRHLLQGDLAGKTVAHIPFVLAYRHVMLAQGRLNEREDLTFFVDSGLEDSEGAEFIAPAQMLTYANIPMPETTTVEAKGGAGTMPMEMGYFPINALGLGTTTRGNVRGVYGLFPPPLYHEMLGFLVDGIVSHNYLRHYAWTIDFSERTMILAQ